MNWLGVIVYPIAFVAIIVGVIVWVWWDKKHNISKASQAVDKTKILGTAFAIWLSVYLIIITGGTIFFGDGIRNIFGNWDWGLIWLFWGSFGIALLIALTTIKIKVARHKKRDNDRR